MTDLGHVLSVLYDGHETLQRSLSHLQAYYYAHNYLQQKLL